MAELSIGLGVTTARARFRRRENDDAGELAGSAGRVGL